MEYLAVLLGLLSVFMAIFLSLKTNALLKGEDKIAKGMIDEGARRTQQMIEESGRRTQQMIEEGDKRTQQMIEEGDKRTQQMIAEGRRETRELIKYIADLIAREGEKTREVVYR